MLPRTLEPELMDSLDEALAYDQMDHRQVNASFVSDLLEVWDGCGAALDLGTGTARIPVELCRRAPEAKVLAVDLAPSMLEVARLNIELDGLDGDLGRIQLALEDSKRLGIEESQFDCVFSNSLVHHLAEPLDALREAVRVARPGGVLFFRDLCRPNDQAIVDRLVEQYAKDESPLAQSLLRQSLQAALTLDEMQALVGQLGFPADTVRMTSDRHWTWSARRTSN